MPQERVIVPSSESDYVSLARTRSGRVFRKHILNKGPLVHPVTKSVINIDDEFFATLRANFEKVGNIVQFPLADKDNRHSEAPDRNLGEVIGLEEENDKLYAIVDVRDPANVDKVGKTILGASAMMNLKAVDTKTNTDIGALLVHVCATNNPYVTQLEDYEEIAASNAADGDVAVLEPQGDSLPKTGDKDTKETAPVSGSPAGVPEVEEPEMPMTLEEMLQSLKQEHGIDVPGLQEQAKAAETEAQAATDKATELSNSLATALKDAGVVKLASEGDISTEDIIGAVAELGEENTKLTSRVTGLEKAAAEAAVDKLRDGGFILPAQRDTFVELKLTNPAMFDRLVPEKPLVALEAEKGANRGDGAHDQEVERATAEIARLTSPDGPAAQYIGAGR